MELTIEQALQQGTASHKEGRLEDAERLYRDILQSQPLHPDANHNLGLLAVSANKADAALPLFKNALEANPKIEQFWLSYIGALIKEQQFDNAKKVLSDGKKAEVSATKLDTLNQTLMLAINDTSPSPSQINSLFEHYQTGRYDDAIKLGIFLTQEFPNHPLAWKALGAMLGKIGKKSEAIKANQRALELFPQDAEAHNNLGMTLQELGRLDEAEVSLKQSIALNPDFAEAHDNLGITLQKLGRLNESEVSFTQAIALKPDYALAHNNLGTTLQKLSRLDEAKTSYRQAIALKPEFAEAHSNLSNTLRKLGKLEFSEASLRQAIALKTDYPEAHYNLGVMLQEQGRLNEAEASYTQAIAMKPDYAEAHSSLGNTLQEQGRLDEAEASYKQSITLKPNYAKAHSSLGVTFQKQGRLNEAEASYMQAIALKPDLAEVHSNLGITLNELGRLVEAEVSSRQAISLKPELAEAHNNLGITLQELGILDESEVSLRQAVVLKTDYAEAHYNLGITLSELGRLDEAEANYNQAIVLKPDYAKAHINLLRCLFLLDKKSLFFDQLNYLINEDTVNATIGSLICRSALKYGVEKPNLFCSEPLQYVLHIDMNTQYDFEETFAEKARLILNENKITNRKQPLLVNGSQTSGNLFDIKNRFTEKIQKAIRLEIEKYRINFKNSEDGLIKKWPTDYSLYGWLISMKSGGELKPHIHDNGWLSGSLYINIPPKSKAESGNLVVSLGEGKDATDTRLNVEKIINVVTGSLVLFPASLTHYTIPFESREERIVLAFDVLPTPVTFK